MSAALNVLDLGLVLGLCGAMLYAAWRGWLL